MSPRKNSEQDFYDALTLTESGCLEFRNKPYKPNGNKHYPYIWLEGKRHPTHRLAYRLAYGEIPEGMMVCHSCDNPWCCNPEHLWVGTAHDNVMDRQRKGRTRGMYL